MADTLPSTNSAPSTPKKVGRPPKVKGARKISQATAVRLKRAQNQSRYATAMEAKILRESKGPPSVASTSETNQVQNMDGGSVDNDPTLSVQNECEMSGSVDRETHDDDAQEQNRINVQGPNTSEQLADARPNGDTVDNEPFESNPEAKL